MSSAADTGLRPLPGEHAASRLAGRSAYTRDLISSEAAVAGFLPSPHPHARIDAIDVGAAAAQEGVLAVLTGDDFGDFRLGTEIADQPVLAHQKVRYVGEPVVAIAARTRETLRAALSVVRVSYTPLPAAMTLDDPPAADLHAHAPGNVARALDVSRGDWATALSNVAVWVQGSFKIAAVQHAYMEPYAVFASFDATEPSVTLHVPTHSPHRILKEYRAWFDRWPETLHLRTPTIGGSFGAKYEHPLHVICAELARRARCDVGIVLPRSQDFRLACSRSETRITMRLGASADGLLIAKRTELALDNGAYSLHGPSVLVAALTRMDNLYRWQAISSSGRLIYTNTPPTQCYRGFGDPEHAFAQEQLLDQLAERVGLSPAEMRRLNAVSAGDRTIHGWNLRSCAYVECLDAVERTLEDDRALAECRDSRPHAQRTDGDLTLDGVAESDRFATGWGLAGAIHLVSNRDSVEPDEAHVRIALVPERITIHSPEVEVGAGTVPLLVRLVSQELGVGENEIEVSLGDSTSAPPGHGSFASRTALFVGNAALDACRRLKRARERLARELTAGLGGPPDWRTLAELASAAGRSHELDVTGRYRFTGSLPPAPDASGNRSPAYTFAAHAARVRVDRWTGTIAVERYWTMHDAGTILLRQAAEGQVVGGVLQGLGHALLERVCRAQNGTMANDGFLDYRIPTSQDAIEVEVGFVEHPDPEGPLGAKGIAEMPMIPVAACVANAIRDALGVSVAEMPMEPEVVHRAAQRAASRESIVAQ